MYGTLASWAKQLELGEDAGTLHAMLDAEKSADDKLSELATSVVNPQAA